MHSTDWDRTKSDLEFAKQQALEYHKAQAAALMLSSTQRGKIRDISDFLTKRLVDDADGKVLMTYLSTLAEDVHPEAVLEDAIYFLTHVEAFLPEHGHPPNEALRSALFWLMLYYHACSPKKMGIGVSIKDGGTQNNTSELVAWLETQLANTGIKNGDSAYGASAIATAARAVRKSDKWTLATDQST